MSSFVSPISNDHSPQLAASRAVRRQPAVWLPGLGLGLLMVLAILSTIFGGKSLGLAFVLAFVFAVLSYAFQNKPIFAISLYIGYEGLEGMFKCMSDFSPAVYVVRPLLLGAICAFWGMSLAKSNTPLLVLPQKLLLGLFIVWGLVEVFNPHGTALAGSIATLLLYYVEPICLFICGYNVLRSSQQVTTFLYALIAVCTAVSLCAILQFSMGHTWTEAHFPGYHNITQTDWFVLDANGKPGVSSFRPASTTAIGGGGGSWAQWGAIFSLGLLFAPGISFKQKIVLAGCVTINIIGLFVTGVRLWLFTGALEAVVFAGVMAKTPRETLRSVGLLLLLATIAGIAFGSAQALSGGIIGSRYSDTAKNPLAKFQHDRGYNVTNFFDYISEFPLGAGYQMQLGRTIISKENTDPAMSERSGETEFGAIGADMGVPGLLLLYGILFGFLIRGWRSFRNLRDPHLRTIGAVLFASLTGYIPASFAGPVLQAATLFWFCAAMLLALPLIEKHERQREAASADKQ